MLSLPTASSAVQWTIVICLTGKKDPLAGLQVTVTGPGRLSVAVAEYETKAPLTEVASTFSAGGRDRLGGVVSRWIATVWRTLTMSALLMGANLIWTLPSETPLASTWSGGLVSSFQSGGAGLRSFQTLFSSTVAGGGPARSRGGKLEKRGRWSGSCGDW